MSAFIFAVAAILTAVLTPIVIVVYRKLGIIDDPKKSSHPKILHTRPLPRGGGIAIFFGVLISILLFVPITKAILGIIGGLSILFFLGIWDDYADPSPVSRFVIQILASCIVVGSGIGVAYITNPFGGIIHLDTPTLTFYALGSPHSIWILADIVAVLWIVWCMNIVNFSTGLDGQMPGYVVVSALTIAILSTRFFPDPTQQSVFYLALITSGAFLGFLGWNMYPQKIISGFGASTMAGFLLAVLSILSGAKFATAILVLGIPMFDALFVIIRRLAHKKSPLYGDRSHFHHVLLDLGLSKRQVAAFYWISAAILGAFSLTLSSEQKLFAILLVAVLLCMMLVWIRFFTIHFGKSARDNG